VIRPPGEAYGHRAGGLAIVVSSSALHSAPPVVTTEDLRHTHATLALQAGIHPKVVSERLGHATVSITLDTYSYAIPAMQEEAAALIAELVLAT
jgi:integrase